MRVGADGSHLRWRRSGIARYLDGMLHALPAALSPDDELVVYYNSLRDAPLFPAPVRERFVRAPKATAWNQAAVPLALRRDRCDVYLGAAHVVPVLSRTPRVVVIHDCLAFRDPATKSRAWGVYLRTWTRRSAHAASRVVAVSRWTALECERWLGIPREAVTVIPGGVDATFRPATDAERERDAETLRRSHGIPPRFVLQVGGHERHKGGDAAAQAVERLRRRGVDVALVRCGIGGGPSRRDGLVDLGYVDEPTLHMLYRCATVVCVASTHEGFGLPVLEAMASGAPVVATRGTALPEVGGDGVTYADGADPRALADALLRLLDDPEERRRRTVAGLERAGRYSWAASARAMAAVLRETAGVAVRPPASPMLPGRRDS